MDLTALFEGIEYRFASGSANALPEIDDVITAPRPDARNTLYVCVNTPLRNGRTGMDAAYAAGCRAFLCTHDAFPGPDATVLLCADPEQVLGVLAARVHGHPARHLTVLGVSGSTGKSSVCLLLREVLVRAGKRVGTVTSDGVWMGEECTPHPVIVPDAADMQRILAKMVAHGVEIALLELSSYQLWHYAAAGTAFLAVALTNFTPRHIGRQEHASLQEYRMAKQRLLDCCAPFSVLPVGAPFQAVGRVLTFGEGGHFSACDVLHGNDSRHGFVSEFTLCAQGERVQISLPLLGEVFVENALIAAALARVVGLTLSQIADGLCASVAPGRMECVLFDRGRAIYVDSAFLPEDLSVVLEALRKRCTGRLSVLLGSVGGRAHYRRAPLGRTACEHADFVYLTADDPDAEEPTGICLEMQEGMSEPLRSVIVPDRRAAIVRAVREMRPGDVLLLAGKGSAAYQFVAGERLPFCERDIVALAAKEI